MSITCVAEPRVAAVLLSSLVMVFIACKKSPPEAHSAPAVLTEHPVAAAAPSAPAPAAAPTGAPPAAPAGDTTPPPGIDLSKLDEFQRKVFFRIVNKEPSACGQAHSLIHSVKNDKQCRKSFYAVRSVARLVVAGFTDSEVAEALTKRYRAGPPKPIEVADAPIKGSPAARVTLVEFVDYECPHCKRLQPVLRQLVDEYRGDVRVFFKHYPLPQHENARLAAEAAVAAHKQGKFWQFEEKLWANQDSLGPADLEKYAKEAGLDVAKWRQEKEAAATKVRVQRDKAEGGILGLSSTPTVYINGREYTDAKDVESLRDWIDEELNR